MLKKKSLRALTLFLLGIIIHSICLGNTILPVDEAFVLDLKKTTPNTLTAHWDIAPNTYLYQKKLKVFAQDENKTAHPIEITHFPEATSLKEPYFEKPQMVYTNTLTLPIALENNKTLNKAETQLNIQYQGCTTSGFCYPPTTKSFKITFQKNAIDTIIPLASHLNEPINDNRVHTSIPSPLTYKSLWLMIGGFYLLGLMLTFTPCILPMLPILSTVILGQKKLSTQKAFLLSGTYVLSMSITYALAGISVALLGSQLQASFQQPWVLMIFASLFSYLGLVQLGLMPLRLPIFLSNKLQTLYQKNNSASYLCAASMGVLATMISSACVSAPLVGALSYISQTGNILLGGMALLSLGLGMGTLLLVMGTLGGKYLPQKGPWMLIVNQFFAILLFGLSIWLLSRILPGPITLGLWAALCFYTGILLGGFDAARNGWLPKIGFVLGLYAAILLLGAIQGHSNPLKPITGNSFAHNKVKQNSALNFTPISTLEDLANKKNQAKAQQKPILLYFYADWCINCKILEETIFHVPQIQAPLKHWYLLKADITQNTKEHQALLRTLSVYGPPTFLFFDENGNELTHQRLVGEQTLETFLKQIEAIQLS